MTTITPEQRLAVVEAGDSPVELADPQTGTAYVLVRADLYRQMRQRLEDDEGHREHRAGEKLARKARDPWVQENPCAIGEGAPGMEEGGVPEGIRRSQEAFFRELPELLKARRLRGKWVAYHGDEQVKIGRTQTEVIKECNRRGLETDQYDVFVIEPQSQEAEEVDFPSSWL